MRATLVVECVCGEAVGRVDMDTAAFNIPGAWERIGIRVQQLLVAHRRGYCAVYHPTGVATHQTEGVGHGT